MRITEVESFILHVPIPRFVTDSLNQTTTWGLPGVIVRTDEGLFGTGYTSTLSHGDHAIKDILDRCYIPRLVGVDPLLHQRIWEDLYWSDAHWVGRVGITQMALAAVDIRSRIEGEDLRRPALEARRRSQGRLRRLLQHGRRVAEVRDRPADRRVTASWRPAGEGSR